VFFENLDESEVPLKHPFQLSPRKKVIVMISVDDPGARSAFARIMSKLRGEDAQDEMAPRFQEAMHMAAIPGPVGLDDVMKEAVIQEKVVRGGGLRPSGGGIR
jgi:hypothetical protein